ncbi:MAG: ComEC/Rec2 family competence protein [Fimbriimonadaceae bacterium]
MRREFSERPLVVALLAMVCGLASTHSPLNLFYIVALAPFLNRTKAWIALGFGLLAGIVLRPTVEPLVTVPGGAFDGTATMVTTSRPNSRGYTAVVDASGRRYLLWLGPKEGFTMGDELRIRADVLPFRMPGLSGQGTVAILRPVRPVERVQAGPWLWQLGDRLRGSFLELTARYGRRETTGIVNALCFNVTSGITPVEYEALRRSGTVHIVSTSGLHVVIVATALAFALYRVPVARVVKLLVLLALLVLYAAAAGFRPPIVRAVAMVGVGLAAYLFQREPDGASAIAASGLGYLLWSPSSINDIGFQLSYVATAGLVLFAPRFDRGVKSLAEYVTRPLLAVVQVSALATVASAPLLAYHFGLVSLIGPVSNALIAIPVAIAVIGSLVAWGVSTIWLGLTVGLLRVVVEPMTGWILFVVGQTSAMPWSAVETPRPAEWLIVLVYALFGLLWRPKLRPAS